MIVRTDTYTRVLLTVIAVLLTLLTIALWFETPDNAPQIHAAASRGLPDAGLQRLKMIEQLDQIHQDLLSIQTIMQSGSLKVQMVNNLVPGNAENGFPASPALPAPNTVEVIPAP